MNAADLPAAYQNQVAAQSRTVKRPGILDEPSTPTLVEPVSAPSHAPECPPVPAAGCAMAPSDTSVLLARSILSLFAAPHHVASTELQRDRVVFEAAKHIEWHHTHGFPQAPGGSPA